MIDAFERDLHAALVARVPSAAPDRLRAAVPGIVQRRLTLADRVRNAISASSLRTALSGATAIGAMVAIVGSVVVLWAFATGGRAVDPGSGGQRPIQWRTETVSLSAAAITIDAGDRRFVGSREPRVTSDPGSTTYSTLEVTWREHGTEMRLNLYLESDGVSWWVSEVRTSDGRGPTHMDWITYPGPIARTPMGEVFSGDLDLRSAGGQIPGRLRIDDMRLAFSPFVADSLQGCRPAIAVPDPGSGPVAVPVVGIDPALGLDRSMTPQQIEARLRTLGICHTYRLEWPDLNFGQIWCRPPEGAVREFSYGSQGEVIVFVEAQTIAPDQPQDLLVSC